MRFALPSLLLALVMPLACGNGGEAPDEARRLLDEGRFVEARTLLLDSHGSRPDALRPAILVARAERECGRPEAALVGLGAIREADRDHPDVAEQQALALLDVEGIHREFRRMARAGRARADAVKAAGRLVEARPEDPVALLLASRAELGVPKRLGAARSLLGEARRNGADSRDVEVAEAWMKVAAGDREGAVGILEELLRKAPDHVKGLTTLASLRAAGGRRDEARRLLAKATRADPADPWAGMDLARMLLASAKHEDALSTVDRVLEHRPDWLGVLRLKARALGLMERWPEAVETLRHADETHPNDPGVLNDLGMALYEGAAWKNDWMYQSVVVHERALKIDPKDVLNRYNVCRPLTKKNQKEAYLRIIGLYEGLLRDIETKPEWRHLLVDIHGNLALILSDSFKRWADAYPHYEMYFRLGGEREGERGAGKMDEWRKMLSELNQPYRAPPAPDLAPTVRR